MTTTTAPASSSEGTSGSVAIEAAPADAPGTAPAAAISASDAAKEAKPAVNCSAVAIAPALPLISQKAASLARCGIFTASDFCRLRASSTARPLIEGILPAGGIGILAGDSGLGKTPLAYQMGICVAAGIPFLGHPTTQADVLIADHENGAAETEDLLKRIVDSSWTSKYTSRH